MEYSKNFFKAVFDARWRHAGNDLLRFTATNAAWSLSLPADKIASKDYVTRILDHTVDRILGFSVCTLPLVVALRGERGVGWREERKAAARGVKWGEVVWWEGGALSGGGGEDGASEEGVKWRDP
jgi:hypothetical protein